MKKLLLGMALTALTCSGASATVIAPTPDFTLDCVKFVSSNGAQSDRDATGVTITGFDMIMTTGKYRVVVDNTSAIPMFPNDPAITGIGFFDALTFLADDPMLSWVGSVVFQNSDAPNLVPGQGFDPMTDIGMERTSGNVDDKGINPVGDILMVDFTPKMGVTGAQITTAFKSGAIMVGMHLQSYPKIDDDPIRTGQSETAFVKNCNAVPEPSRALFGLLGVMGSVFIRRRPRSKK